MKAAIVTGIALLLVLACSASAGNRVSYPDPTGDASTGKLDVTSVGVQVNNAGSVFTFRVTTTRTTIRRTGTKEAGPISSSRIRQRTGGSPTASRTARASSS